MDDTIHVLGLGSVGILVAHALAGIPSRPRLNLLLHRPRNCHSRVLAVTREGATEYQDNITTEEYRDSCWYHGTSRDPSIEPVGHAVSQNLSSNETPISFLIVAVKAHHTVRSLQLVKHRLSSCSAILFLQNGLGILDDLDTELFPDSAERPYYMTGIVTHGARRKDYLSIIHTAKGSIDLGPSPRIARTSSTEISFQLPSNAERLAGIMNQTSVLNVSLQHPRVLLRRQLMKLAMNSIYNPLTSLLDCSIETLIKSENTGVQIISDALVCEFSKIIRALPLAGLLNKEELGRHFSPVSLKTTVYQMALRAGDHTTSMLQDIRNQAETEIMYLDGYFTRWAFALEIRCPVNDKLGLMVLDREILVTGNFSPNRTVTRGQRFPSWKLV
ncbi:hypothetical protein ASPSYDRAFT_1162722 [Aspergillus sydowii CBS 593.65]|uniref:2-dehydropantoate 2-reductase n=1 Tax=Aspergillus sydowii CBS 593.65 TaxID=1036612 RepID=A0A1L9T2K9_9EURO|nr:uncharacterized protein ASPSYDRAFT_1162722 [Aspergillus sydowii CBS 593.65]OJJ53649.1 hypothetical protein ASPSYDRAFT_1162722 [Aspergillus sydowii CBS 593.65]